MASVRDTCIVVPCYNEAHRIDITPFLRHLETREWLRFVFVNDGSTDKTGMHIRKIEAAAPDRSCAILTLESNTGKAAAVHRGVRFAVSLECEFVGYWDADLATSLTWIDEFRRTLIGRPKLIGVIGERPLSTRTFRRGMLSLAFRVARRICLKQAFRDSQCGAKLFRVSPSLDTAFSREFVGEWIFDAELLLRLPVSSIATLRIEDWREQSGSRIKTHAVLSSLRDLLVLRSVAQDAAK